MNIPIIQVDAFTSKVFAGNPAAICPLKQWLNDETMQLIAEENNLSETAFIVPEDNGYGLRWFTPSKEVEMCGHATLAAAYVIFETLGYEKKEIFFWTKSGRLKVWRSSGMYLMDFPVLPTVSLNLSETIEKIFLRRPLEVFGAMDIIVVFEREEDVQKAVPDPFMIKQLDRRGVALTAPGDTYDFVTRFFAPKYGIDEDPVTGSLFPQLIRYWSSRLKKDSFHVKQLSARGGEVWCRLKGERVEIGGYAAKYLEGVIHLERRR